MFELKDRVGDIVTKFPGAAEIFQANKIDYCCGGNRSLRLAIEEDSQSENIEIDSEKLIKELNKSYEDEKDHYDNLADPGELSKIELIDYIIANHHQYLRENLPRIDQLTRKIFQAHYQSHKELLAEIHQLFNSLKGELEAHLIKEEEEVFPLIIEEVKTQNNNSEISQERLAGIAELEDEHDAAGDIFKRLRRLTNDYALPGDTCNSFELTYQLLKDLEANTFQHIHLENNILFK